MFGKAGSDAAYRAVDDLNLEVRPGEMLALLGKTGCGKSTIFNMVAGLTAPTSGTVRVSGRDPFADFDSFRGKMAIVFQSDRLLPWRTAIQNVELGLEMLEVPTAERQATAQLWLTKLGLGGHEHDYPHALSGGMRQRVSIARAFATNANILLCDEPFSALDESTAGRLRAEFVAAGEGKRQDRRIHHALDQRGAGDRRPYRGAETSREDRLRRQLRCRYEREERELIRSRIGECWRRESGDRNRSIFSLETSMAKIKFSFARGGHFTARVMVDKAPKDLGGDPEATAADHQGL